MDLDENSAVFRYEFQVEHSGAFYFETILYSYLFFSFI